MWNELAPDGVEVTVEHQVAVVTLNRPERRNAVHPPMRRALLRALEETRADPDIRAVLVTGAGSAFCSGADVSGVEWTEIPPERRRGNPSNVVREDGLRFGWWRVVQAIWESEKPFVAAVNGAAYGFGCNLALACDLVIAGESAQFCEVFVRRGLPVEAGGAWILPRVVGVARAKEMILFGEPVGGSQAAEWGLANRCVPDDQLMEVATEWARKLAGGPSIAIGHAKFQVNQSLDSSLSQSFREEVTLMGIGSGADATEARDAAREKREPRFTGR